VTGQEPMTFGALLRRLRAEAGLTQEELAEAASLSPRSVSDLERGINLTPRKETARLLADALQLAGPARAAFEAAARGRTAGGEIPARGWPASGMAAATRTLPRDIASFTGRESELLQLVGAAAGAAGSGGVVGIHAIGGMAGIGKTTLAVHAAHQLAPQFPDGQIFLPLHGHTPGHQPVDPVDALASLLMTTGVAAAQIPPGMEARMALWRDHLVGRQLLLLLDDAVGHEQVRPLLPGTAGSLVLVTSRRHLTALEDSQVLSLDTMPPDEAASLLIQLAARPDLDSRDEAVSQITRLCGYLPLAIGMLARQLCHHPAWTAADLAVDLAAARDRLELFAAENLSVTAAFDLSYQDLTAEQQRLFRRLGLHPGTEIDTYAAAALDDTDLGAARRGLESLYDQYLLAEPTRGRYRFHDLIREHSRVLAAADPPADRDAAVGRLLDYYLHTAHVAGRYIVRRFPAVVPAEPVSMPAHTPNLATRKDAVAWMSAERLNLHAAAGHAISRGQSRYATAIPAVMHEFLRSQGHWDQALTLYRDALGAARAAGDRAAEARALSDIGAMQLATGGLPAAAVTLEQALELFRNLGDILGEAGVLNNLGIMHYMTGNFAASTGSLTRALELYRDLGNRQGEASASSYLGVAQYLSGEYPAATASLTRALDLSRDPGDRQGEAIALTYLGTVQQAMGEYPAATASLTRALDLSRDLGDRQGEANALNYLGAVQRLTGDYAAAVASQDGALKLYRQVGSRLGEANAVHDLGYVQYLTGDYLAATASQEHALELYRRMGHRLGQANSLSDLGTAQQASGDYPEAEASLIRALQLHRDLGNRLGEAGALKGLSAVRQATGNYPAAAVSQDQALELYREVGDRLGQAEILNQRGDLLLSSTAPGEARASYEQALVIAAAIASPPEEARALEGIGRCHLQDAEPDQAAMRLRQAMEIYQRIGSSGAGRIQKTLSDHGL
jgi:tetratricopeptide (TPR) repeat protein/transcriptional regulator with XRE-family HTH domain